MFEVFGHYILRLFWFRRPTAVDDVFGSFYQRKEGAVEFVVGLLGSALLLGLVIWLSQ